MRARRILDYRKSDLNEAIADLNKAIQFDPRFLADAYIDHRTILYRLQKFERAVASVTGAKRIDEKTSRTIAANDGQKAALKSGGNRTSVTRY